MGPQFQRYVGVDYSGAATPTSMLNGLRVCVADRAAAPVEVQGKWSRRGAAEWLEQKLSEAKPTLVGIDHGFSFPLEYFTKYQIPLDWPTFLKDFRRHWPTDQDDTSVEALREGNARFGNSRWRRLTEVRSGAKSVFHFDVQGSVAKSTHSGLPWLLYLRGRLGEKVHFWPFDGWRVPAGKSVIVEAYPSLWSKSFSTEGRNPHQHDAYAIAAWMRDTDATGSLGTFFDPELEEQEKKKAEIEGWILGFGAKRDRPSTKARLTMGSAR